MRKIKDTIFFPIRCLLPNNEYISFLGVTPLCQEKFDVVKRYLKGNVLDIGCGDNRLVKEYRRNGNTGVGIDIPLNKNADIKIEDSRRLPFKDNTFDTVTFVASLNHIPEREAVLQEAKRCLNNNGVLLIVVLNRLIGCVGHKLWHILGSDADLASRKMQEGERYGLSKSEIFSMLQKASFKDIRKKSFSFGFNNLFIARK